MTAFVAGLAVGAAGVAYTHVCWWRAWHRWADQHAYRRVKLAATRVEILYHEKDSAERLARRWHRRAVVARHHVGDLTIQLAAARPRRDPVPVYGPRRQVTA